MEQINGNLDYTNLITPAPNVWTKDMNSLFLDSSIILNEPDRWNFMVVPRDSVGSFEFFDKSKKKTGKLASKKDIGIYFIKRLKISTGEWIYWYVGETGVSFNHRMYMFVRSLRKSCTDGDQPHSAAVAVHEYCFDDDWSYPHWVDLDSKYMFLPDFRFCFIHFDELDFNLVNRTITETHLYGKEEYFKTDEDLRKEFETKCINEFKPIANQRQRNELYRYREHVVENNILEKFAEINV